MTAASLTNQDQKFWAPRADVVEWLTALIPAAARVLEVGPGSARFPRADTFVGWTKPDAIPDDRFHRMDVQRDPLPFGNKTFDFVYCRHVVEDLYDPFFICAEMSRVARAGYIETPSPLSEVCRGIDGNSPDWRGYHHHRYFVWNKGGVLYFLTKYPVVEYLQLEDEATVTAPLRGGPRFWNTHLLWRGELQVRYLQHEVDYWITRNYGEMLNMAITDCLKSADEFSETMATTRSLFGS